MANIARSSASTLLATILPRWIRRPVYHQCNVDMSREAMAVCMSLTTQKFLLLDASSIPDDRIAVLGNRPRPARKPPHSLIVVLAKQLDDMLVPLLPGGHHIPRRQRTK